MSEYGKKVYTLEDNIKYISFGIKDLVKQLEQINISLHKLVDKKSGDEKDLPF